MKSLSLLEAHELVLEQATQSSRFLFDCDGTLIRGDINGACFRSLLPLGLIDDLILPQEWQRRSPYVLNPNEFDELQKIITKEFGERGYFEWEVKAFRGLPRKTVREAAIAILNGHTIDHSVETHTPAWQLAEKVKLNSWIVSGSERSCIEGVADIIGIPREHVVASELHEVDGIMNHVLEEPGINWMNNKVINLQKRGVSDAYLCAGDSTGDIELLDLANGWRWCVIQFDPNTPDYKRIFRELILKELNFNHTTLAPGFYAFENTERSKVLLQVVTTDK